MATEYLVSNNNYTTTNNNSSNNNNNNNQNNSEIIIDIRLKTISNIAEIMNMYYVPFLVFCGGFGNIFSLVVFSRTKLSKLSSSYYLSALVISDTCFLFGLFFQWLNLFGLHIYNRPYFCQFFTFFSNLACFCSAWFVAAFTVERFIAIMYPLRRQVLCTVRRAKITLGIVFLLGIFHCVPFGIYSTPISMDNVNICDIRREVTDKVTLLNYWDTIVVFAIPFVIIVVVNTLTCCIVWKFAGIRRILTMNHHHRYNNNLNRKISQINGEMAEYPPPTNMEQHVDLDNEQRVTTFGRCPPTNATITKTTTNTTNTMTANTTTITTPTTVQSAPIIGQTSAGILRSRASRQRNKALNSQIKITRMLMIVSTAFIALNLPSTLLRIKTYWETQSASTERLTIVLQYIFNLLFMTNFGINFPLYCLSGQNFRKAVLSMICPNYVRNNTQVTSSLHFFSQHRRQHHTASRANSNLLD